MTILDSVLIFGLAIDFEIICYLTISKKVHFQLFSFKSMYIAQLIYKFVHKSKCACQ